MENQKIPSVRIILCSEVPAEKRDLHHVFSIEAGLSDNIRHFDHHKPEHKKNPSPANNPKIGWYYDGKITQDAEIYVTHIDADTFIGVSRLVVNGWCKHEFTGFDYSVIEKLDLNGSSAIEGNLSECREYLFALGLSENAKILFPRCTKEPVDVTAQFERFEWFAMPQGDCSKPKQISLDDLLRDGKTAFEKSENSYIHCKQDYAKGDLYDVGFWVIGQDDPFDPSRPYRDGCNVVVVYRKHYKSISIYADPTLPRSFNSEWSGVQFAGHPKACGSPRGEEMTRNKAWEVWAAIAKTRFSK